jgi:hypothetical protein
MTELWFYSGRVGNCMFMYAFTRLVAHMLGHKANLPKGTEITEFPLIKEDSKGVEVHDHKYTVGGPELLECARTVVNENDNMGWFIDPAFKGEPINSFFDLVTIKKIMNTPEVYRKWLVLLGNFELGENYYPYRNILRQWFKFPELDMTKFEFFKLHPELGKDNWFSRYEFNGEIHPDDLVISLRLEDYTSPPNLDRLLDYDYFKIILESRKFNRLFIITNPGSIGHNNQYRYTKEFFPYDPIYVRIYDRPIMSMAFGAQFNNIAISQSTYSWWLAFLSHAKNIYYPIPKTGPFSITDKKYPMCDLRVPCSEFKYVDYETRTILPDDQYLKIDYENSSWKP